MREKVSNQSGEFIFLAAVTVFAAITFYETTTFLPVSAAVPQFIIILIGASLVLIFTMKFWGDKIKKAAEISDANAGFELRSGAEDADDQMSGLYELNTVGVVKEMVWISAYVLSVIYVGFFTTTAIFCIVYILLKETSPIKRRVPLAIGWTGLMLGILYLLFVYFLQVSSVWRLGFLP